MLASLTGFSSKRYDVTSARPLRRAYVVASSYRSGSTYLCTRMWRTGVLGAPFEYYNYEHEMKFMYSRLGANSAADYLEKLLACRMTGNGIFGLKAHFRHFAAALRFDPQLLDKLSPCHFIFIRRRDQVAQAVSLAKAYQTRSWFSLGPSGRQHGPLFYSKDFISACLMELRNQESAWMEWFRANRIVPHTVHYEDILTNEQQLIRELCALLSVLEDEPSRVTAPDIERQFDATNREWIDRFRSDDSPPAASD